MRAEIAEGEAEKDEQNKLAKDSFARIRKADCEEKLVNLPRPR